MNEEIMDAQIKEVLSDKEFTTSLLNMETPEEVQQALKDKKVDLTIADITVIRNALEQQNGELSEDDLALVSGGSLTVMAALGIASLIMGICAGIGTMAEKTDTWTRRRW